MTRRRKRGGPNEPFPWDDWLEGAFGALQWTPETFWRSTLTEFMRAIDAFNKRHGGEKSQAPSDGEMADLLARFG